MSGWCGSASFQLTSSLWWKTGKMGRTGLGWMCQAVGHLWCSKRHLFRDKGSVQVLESSLPRKTTGSVDSEVNSYMIWLTWSKMFKLLVFWCWSLFYLSFLDLRQDHNQEVGPWSQSYCSRKEHQSGDTLILEQLTNRNQVGFVEQQAVKQRCTQKTWGSRFKHWGIGGGTCNCV